MLTTWRKNLEISLKEVQTLLQSWQSYPLVVQRVHRAGKNKWSATFKFILKFYIKSFARWKYSMLMPTSFSNATCLQTRKFIDLISYIINNDAISLLVFLQRKCGNRAEQKCKEVDDPAEDISSEFPVRFAKTARGNHLDLCRIPVWIRTAF